LKPMQQPPGEEGRGAFSKGGEGIGGDGVFRERFSCPGQTLSRVGNTSLGRKRGKRNAVRQRRRGGVKEGANYLDDKDEVEKKKKGNAWHEMVD